MTQPTKAILYARVSTDEQGEGPSLDEQLRVCRLYAAQHGLSQVAEFKEEFTGTTLKRPQFEKVLKMLQEGRAGALVVAVHDRLSRNYLDFLILRDQLDKAGIELHYANTGPSRNDFNGLLTESIQALLSHGERLRIIDRTRNGKFAHARRGRVVQGLLPYGYARDDNKNIVIVDEYAYWAKKIFEWFAYGDEFGGPLKIREIANELNKRGVPPPSERKNANNGYTWVDPTIYRLLTNPFYSGKAMYGRTRINDAGKPKPVSKNEWVEIDVPAIVDRKIFLVCQRRLKENKTQAKRRRKHEYLLTGRIRCKHCGLAMVGHSRQRGDKIYRYYCCSNWNRRNYHSNRNCPVSTRNINAEMVERAVARWLIELLNSDKKLIEGLKKMEQSANDALEEKVYRCAWVKKRIKNDGEAIDSLIANFKTATNRRVQEALKREVDSLVAQLETLESELISLERDIAEKSFPEDTYDQVLSLARRVRERLGDATYEDIRDVLNILDVKVEVKIDPKRSGHAKIWVTAGFPEGGVSIDLPISSNTQYNAKINITGCIEIDKTRITISE